MHEMTALDAVTSSISDAIIPSMVSILAQDDIAVV